jgi:hypothetical protein
MTVMVLLCVVDWMAFARRGLIRALDGALMLFVKFCILLRGYESTPPKEEETHEHPR